MKAEGDSIWEGEVDKLKGDTRGGRVGGEKWRKWMNEEKVKNT